MTWICGFVVEHAHCIKPINHPDDHQWDWKCVGIKSGKYGDVSNLLYGKTAAMHATDYSNYYGIEYYKKLNKRIR